MNNMKKNLSLLIPAVTIALVAFYACKKDKKEINLNLSEVTNIFAPADNKYIKLNPAANLTETFEWDQARAEDGALVLYEVAFDQENGDFSKPIYTIVSNARGVENKLTLTHGQLNQIAALGGSDFFQRKKFKWTVLASKGTNVKKASVARIIDLERPGGFAVIPGTVYITGSATENGTNLAQALKMQQVSAGVFEIFCKLKAGTYKFVDGITGTPREFYLRDNAGSLELAVNGTSTFTGPDKVMRIRINFNDINGSRAEIKRIQMWYCHAGAFKTDLNYTSNGEWRSSGYVADWIPVGWSPGGEDRYKYKMVYNDGTGDKDLWINSFFGDPNPQSVYPSTAEYRKVNLDKNDGSQYDWGWKMVMSAVPIGSTVDFWVTLRGSDPFYTQNYQKQ
jgi:starch-binding outer membrane protein SusE/F